MLSSEQKSEINKTLKFKIRESRNLKHNMMELEKIEYAKKTATKEEFKELDRLSLIGEEGIEKQNILNNLHQISL